MELQNNNHQPLPRLSNILVVGSGGRENALAWALIKSPIVQKVWVTPGNGGTNSFKNCVPLGIKETDLEALLDKCASLEIDLVVIGPEVPLSEGLADDLRNAGLTVFGPSALGAQLEASKAWAKNLMTEAGIPTAKHWTVKSESEAISLLSQLKRPLVVKADGLASGKGVIVPESIEETEKAISKVFNGEFGNAAKNALLEERLFGPEVSVFALCDGKEMILLPPAQDHKRLKEGDRGPNTGGMGAYAPAPLLDESGLNEVKSLILEPTLAALQKKRIDYRGVIYAGLMLTESGPKVIEFNCRFGDPECQTLMPLMGPEFAHILQACALGCLNKSPTLSKLNCCSACVVAAASGYPENPRKDDPINITLPSSTCLQVFHAGTKLNSEEILVTSGGRVLSVVGQGENFDEAFELVYKGLEKVHFQGIVFRNDIGHQVRKNLMSI